MSTFWLKANTLQLTAVDVPSSKSICNRLLVLQKLIGQSLTLTHLSDADDSQIMQQALQQTLGTVNVKNAGTCMRFLTAYFAATSNTNIVLDGSERMRKRPIKPLVDALIKLGADIEYAGEVGYPPLKIKGKKLKGGALKVDASVSSQFTSAILLVAPWFENELTLKLDNNSVSVSYIYMTVKLLQQCGALVDVNETSIIVKPRIEQKNQTLAIEKDWSSAAFWFGLMAIYQQQKLTINNLTLSGVQGDELIADIMKHFGVCTSLTPNGLELTYQSTQHKNTLEFDMNTCPDLVPVLAVVACATNRKVTFTHVAHLQAKESNRLDALCTELKKCGFHIWHNTNELHIEPTETSLPSSSILLNTYDDHRLAMAFSLLALIRNEVGIKDAECVEKSYPNWWNEYQKLGFDIRTETE